jgi:hypothetical protein
VNDKPCPPKPFNFRLRALDQGKDNYDDINFIVPDCAQGLEARYKALMKALQPNDQVNNPWTLETNSPNGNFINYRLPNRCWISRTCGYGFVFKVTALNAHNIYINQFNFFSNDGNYTHGTIKIFARAGIIESYDNYKMKESDWTKIHEVHQPSCSKSGSNYLCSSGLLTMPYRMAAGSTHMIYFWSTNGLSIRSRDKERNAVGDKIEIQQNPGDMDIHVGTHVSRVYGRQYDKPFSSTGDVLITRDFPGEWMGIIGYNKTRTVPTYSAKRVGLVTGYTVVDVELTLTEDSRIKAEIVVPEEFIDNVYSLKSEVVKRPLPPRMRDGFENIRTDDNKRWEEKLIDEFSVAIKGRVRASITARLRRGLGFARMEIQIGDLNSESSTFRVFYYVL